MKNFYLPEKILDFVAEKDYISDDIVMSDSSVLAFEDMVLKIRNDSDFIKKWAPDDGLAWKQSSFA